MKRHLPLAAILIMAYAGFCFAQPQATASPSPAAKPRAPRLSKAQLQKQLSEMETALWTAWKNKDPKPFQRHLAADVVGVGDMGVSGKSSTTDGLNGCDVRSFSLSDWKLTRFNDNTAVITYKGTQDATCGGQAVPGTMWASSVWMKRKGTWQAVFHQETPAK